MGKYSPKEKVVFKCSRCGAEYSVYAKSTNRKLPQKQPCIYARCGSPSLFELIRRSRNNEKEIFGMMEIVRTEQEDYEDFRKKAGYSEML